jgi:hypothetical protein
LNPPPFFCHFQPMPNASTPNCFDGLEGMPPPAMPKCSFGRIANAKQRGIIKMEKRSAAEFI